MTFPIPAVNVEDDSLLGYVAEDAAELVRTRMVVILKRLVRISPFVLMGFTKVFINYGCMGLYDVKL